MPDRNGDMLYKHGFRHLFDMRLCYRYYFMHLESRVACLRSVLDFHAPYAWVNCRHCIALVRVPTMRPYTDILWPRHAMSLVRNPFAGRVGQYIGKPAAKSPRRARDLAENERNGGVLPGWR